MTIWPSKAANKLFSWALVRQMASYCFHACVYKKEAFTEYLMAWLNFTCMTSFHILSLVS